MMKKLIGINPATHAMLKVVAATERRSLHEVANEILEREIQGKLEAVHDQITKLQEPQQQPA